ncbi:hypothetical protein PTKIN_Ptkin01aG0323000 [Pterospermum kingtungense]
MHSILDFLVCRCGLAVDEFVQEAVSDAVWNPELEKLLTNDQLNCLAEPIAFCIIWVVLEKCVVLMSVSGNAIWVLVRLRRPSCYFAEEVYDLVKIADGLRRNQDHRFINTHHILWAIRLTGLKDLVDELVKSVGLRNVVEEPAKCPSYFVYKTAQATAEYHGNEVVEVEHLAVATVFEMEWNQRNLCEFKEEEHMENLREFNKRECVTQFITDVRSYKRECADKFFWVSFNLDPEAKITSGGGSIHSAVKKYGVPKPLYIRPDFDDQVSQVVL